MQEKEKAVFIDAMHEAFTVGKEPGSKEILEAITRTMALSQLMDGIAECVDHV